MANRLKSERDVRMNRLTPEERQSSRRVIQQIHEQRKAAAGRSVKAPEVLEAQGNEIPLPVRQAGELSYHGQ